MEKSLNIGARIPETIASVLHQDRALGIGLGSIPTSRLSVLHQRVVCVLFNRFHDLFNALEARHIPKI
jgi:hypothetical protein